MSAPSIGMAAPLPTAFRGTPQQWFEEMIKRLSLENMPVGFVTSSAMPTTNQGPWLKNGNEIWCWDNDSATYVPQSLSFLNQQVYIGDINSTAPDPTKYQIWLQTNGAVFVGFALYMGSYVGWVTQQPATGVADGAIATSMLQDDSVTSTKLADGAVTTGKLQNFLPPSKLLGGTAGQVLRTAQDGTTVAWDTLLHEGIQHPYTNNTSDTFIEPHGLPVVPRLIRLVLVCISDETATGLTYLKSGTELDVSAVYGDPSGSYIDGKPFIIYADASNISVKVFALSAAPKLRGGSGTSLTLSKWKLKLYWAR